MPSFGEELKRERELREISLREVSEATKISFRHLEALEANEFGELPGGVFNRGFVRAYAQFIGVDAESMVTSYLMEEQAQQRADAKQDETVVLRRQGGVGSIGGQAVGTGPLTDAQLRWGLAVIATLVILVGGLLLWSWLTPDEESPTTTAEPVGDGRSAPQPDRPERAAAVEPHDPPPDEQAGEADEADEAENENDAKPPPPQQQDPDESPVTRSASMTAPRPTATPEAKAAAPVETIQVPPRAPGEDSLETRIRVVRATTGRVNCDNTRIEILGGMRPGTEVEFRCKHFLLIDVADAGAIELALGDRPAAALGEDGQRLSSHRIELIGDRG